MWFRLEILLFTLETEKKRKTLIKNKLRALKTLILCQTFIKWVKNESPKVTNKSCFQYDLIKKNLLLRYFPENLQHSVLFYLVELKKIISKLAMETFTNNKLKSCVMGTKCAPSYINIFTGQLKSKNIYDKISKTSHFAIFDTSIRFHDLDWNALRTKHIYWRN